MSSGGGKTTTTVQNSGPPDWATGYFKDAFGRANQLSNQPYVGYGGPRIADFTQDQQNAFNETRHQANNNYLMSGVGDAYVSDMLAGKGGFNVEKNPYSGQNPYLDQMIGNAQQDVTRAYQESVVPQTLSQFNSAGAYGGTAMQQAMAQDNRGLAEQLGRVSSNLRNADYDRQAQLAGSYLGRQQSAWSQDMSNRQAALGMLPSLAQSRFSGAQALGNIGLQQQGLLQNAIDTDYGDFQEWRDWDKNNFGVLTNALAALNGGTVESKTGVNPNYRSAGQNAASVAQTLAAMWFMGGK